jgi:deazaflavin-dependent oxidoreductase (nitroreductase family)
MARRRLPTVADRHKLGSGPMVASHPIVKSTTAFGFAHRSATTLAAVPSDFSLKDMNRVHRVLLGASGGRLGWRFSGMPVLELTTIGRKTGQPRTTMLTSPYQEGTTIVVVASRGGDDTDPAWFLNLRDDPEVTVRFGPNPPVSMTAQIADADERARIWPIISVNHSNYAGYQRKTEREIPLVLLRPTGD